jgi:peptidyl-prolyl cis-trans isomerase B (cyclophilin B)
MLLSTLCSACIATSLFGFGDSADQLLKRYQLARTSIMNQRGLAPGDLESVKDLCEELGQWNADHDDVKIIAAELQMSIWLDELAQCNILFGRLADLQPEDSRIGLAWADFLINQEGSSAESVYTDLMDRYPDSSEIATGWVRFLDSRNRFTEGIEVLEEMRSNAMLSAEVTEFYADLLFADNRFEDAIAALDSIDIEALTSPSLSSKINVMKTRYKTASNLWNEELAIQEAEEINDDLPEAQIITSKGSITIKLFEDHAPNTVANFISLAESGFYDGTRFHRVLQKFMAQGGDSFSRDGADGQAGTGDPGYKIKDEHTGDDIRKHFAGSLSMAKATAPDSAGSQFFLTHLPTPHLDGRHTVFGRITDGLDIARALEQNDEILTVLIFNKRDHDYTPEIIGGSETIIETKATQKSKKPQRNKPTLNSNIK